MDWQSLFINMKYGGICGCLVAGLIIGLGLMFFSEPAMQCGFYLLVPSLASAFIGEMLA
jgi:hypothetical protein